MKTDNICPDNSLDFSSREFLIKANAELIENLQRRINVKRFRPQEGDSIKLSYMRVFLQALQVQNAILKDLELEDLKQRLEVLEAMQAGSLVEEEDCRSDLKGPEAGDISEFEKRDQLTENTWRL